MPRIRRTAAPLCRAAPGGRPRSCAPVGSARHCVGGHPRVRCSPTAPSTTSSATIARNATRSLVSTRTGTRATNPTASLRSRERIPAVRRSALTTRPCKGGLSAPTRFGRRIWRICVMASPPGSEGHDEAHRDRSGRQDIARAACHPDRPVRSGWCGPARGRVFAKRTRRSDVRPPESNLANR